MDIIAAIAEQRRQDLQELQNLRDLQDLQDLQDVQDLVNQPRRAPIWRRNRLDPFTDIQNEREFKARFRFDRPNLHKVVELVKPFLDLGDSNRGLPISAELIVCSALEMMAGGHFYWVGGYTCGTALSTAWKNMKRFVNALLTDEVRRRFLCMPSSEQQRENISEVFKKYKLNNVIGGVDSINAQIIGGFDRRIYDILLTAPGSFHDAAVCSMSQGKGWLETRFPQRFFLGESAYPQTEVMMTPYSED
ncbi:uncharacterized protein LOC111707651 [Eurytemora carolleeae]|uniref:uncharacterized protein LOC111707651 n=1 Tax=Eurytemora carolleeae TaxID=1294199 RepID=UPI000C779817|nr:uncharacterized protein LOC111707651 [Eurytemora carolleeae]|eukprot:XP_023336552.1 uncharacterized protein LOC111707651 [Eurytemora affinis]